MFSGNVHKTDALLSNSETSICGLIPIQWHGQNWAISCLFEGNDLSQVKGKSDICTTQCDATPGDKSRNICLNPELSNLFQTTPNTIFLHIKRLKY